MLPLRRKYRITAAMLAVILAAGGTPALQDALLPAAAAAAKVQAESAQLKITSYPSFLPAAAEAHQGPRGEKGAYPYMAAAVAAEVVRKVEVEYARFTADGKLHAPVPLPNGKLMAVTDNGWANVIDGDGKAVWKQNLYTKLSAPAVDAAGNVWFGGESARLYRFNGAGVGSMLKMYHFSGKKDGFLTSGVVIDELGTAYMAYEHGLVSMAKDAKTSAAAVLPAGVKTAGLVAGKRGVYALGSNATLYAAEGGAIRWQARLDDSLRGAKLAPDGRGGVLLLAGKALAAYDADGTLRYMRELSAAAPAGGWTAPAVLPGAGGVLAAAEQGGSRIAGFRLEDGAELWRVSAAGAGGGFAPAALAPDRAAGLFVAGSRSGALYAIAPGDGATEYVYGGAAGGALPASGVTPLGGGRIAYASAGVLALAGPNRPAAITYAAATVKLPVGSRLLLSDKLKLSVPVAVSYRSDKPAVATVNDIGVLTPIAAGTATITIEAVTPGYKGQLKLPVQVTPPSSALKARTETKKLQLSGRTYTVQTITIPKGLPVTAALAGRRIGAVQLLQDIAKGYRAEAAINGTFFESYGGIPEPWGTVISDGRLEHIGNLGTAAGFTWDGTVLMDTLRVSIQGGTNGSYSYPNNWYAYFVNRTPAAGASAAILYTPKRGAKLGFARGRSVTIRGGKVTAVQKNVNAVIPADGYVLNFTGAEEKLADRFKVGVQVDYKTVTTNLAKQPVNWSRVHTALGAGPRLVRDGKLAVDPVKEGFNSPKITRDAATRSALLVKKDGTIMLATVPSATMKQWGSLMLQLGAYQAMNMDGGASSGLYFQGRVITAPGRTLSNLLVFGSNLKW
ncbi:phosphodiester glycosidase family protein [Paenibacillus sp. GCM10023252]|uniref:phosphodiester glycosidase family protein n=1 Tax=Paenibacillus sp. GCM10023252 TaxID=3252649 RepID=UPI00361CA040